MFIITVIIDLNRQQFLFARHIAIFHCIALMKASRSDGIIANYFVMTNNFKLNKKNAFVCIFGEASNVPLNCCMTLVKLGNQIHALEDGRRNSL